MKNKGGGFGEGNGFLPPLFVFLWTVESRMMAECKWHLKTDEWIEEIS